MCCRLYLWHNDYYYYSFIWWFAVSWYTFGDSGKHIAVIDAKNINLQIKKNIKNMHKTLNYSSQSSKIQIK